LVAKGYRSVDRDQQFLLPKNMRDLLPASDPVWLVISVVAGLDTSRLHAKRRTGGAGRAGYDRDMLLILLIWAWAQGVRSSRVIEQRCQRLAESSNSTVLPALTSPQPKRCVLRRAIPPSRDSDSPSPVGNIVAAAAGPAARAAAAAKCRI
jgi:hypothetical protein